MRTSLSRQAIGTVAIISGMATFLSAADESLSRPGQGKAATTSSTSRAGATRGGSARGPLPDPALLDGSGQPAEKRPEYGMIGDFELPGDENVKSGKVGGQQTPNQQGSGGQQGNLPMGLPKMGGAGGQQQSPQGQMPQGAEAQGAQGGQQAQQGAAPQNQSGGNPGTGDPGGQAQGIQVSEIGGPQNGPQGADATAGAGDKPQAVAIGDKAMRIETGAPQAGVVGAQQVAGPNTQQHEKGTGSGGKGPVGTGGPNRVEKGRAIPAGL